MRIIVGSCATACGLAIGLVLATLPVGDANTAAAAPRTEKQCDDGVDNDRDGLTDADDPDCNTGNGGGVTGNGQDTAVDVYLFHADTFGIIGDEWFTGGDATINPDGDATIYPANKELSGETSCASAIMTDQAQGYVRMFVPAGDNIACAWPNRLLRIRSDYDLDQDGLCVIPYAGRQNAGEFSRFYDCLAGPEPDGYEDVMVTLHLHEVLGPGASTPFGIQVRLLDYGDDYEPDGAYDPNITDIQVIGSQQRSFNIELQGVTMTTADSADAEVRIFENQQGTATICEVVWKNSHAKDCIPIVDGTGDPIVITGLTVKGKVDPTPVP